MTGAEPIPELVPRGRLVGAVRLGQVHLRRASTSGRRGDLVRLLPRPGRRRRERPGGHHRRLRRAALHRGQAAAAGRLTVVDATNVQPEARRQLVELAKEHDVLPVAIVLDLPEQVCARAQRGRGPTATSAPHVVRRQRDQLRRSLRGLGNARASARCTCCAASRRSTAPRIVREKLLNDLRDQHGPFDVIGDVHGCRAELESAAGRARLRARPRRPGRPVDAAHPEGRRPVFVGDLVDRGPDTPGRAAPGDGDGRRPATPSACPATTRTSCVRALRRPQRAGQPRPRRDARAAGRARPPEFRSEVAEFCDGLVSPLRPRRRPARRRARRAARRLPRPGLGPGPQLRAVRRHDRRDRRVRPAGALPVGGRLPRQGDGGLRPHARRPSRSGSTTRSASTPAASSAGG